MTRSPSLAASSVPSDDETDKSFSDTEAFIHRAESRTDNHNSSSEETGWELDYIEDSRITILEEPSDKVERSYKLKFKGYEDSEWQPENNVDALELVRCFWENVLLGSEACIKAQQELLIQMENRPESDEDSSNPLNDTNRSNTNTTTGYNQNSRLVKKKFKQLKPRYDAVPDSDLAESDSNSSCAGDDDSDDEPLKFPLPFTFCSEYLSLDHDINSNLALSNTFECSYQSSTPKIRKQMKQIKHALCSTTTNISSDRATSSSLVDRVDLQSLYAYKAHDSEIAKQMEKAIDKIRFDSLKIDEVRQRSKQVYNKPKLQLILDEENRNPIHSPFQADIPAPSLRHENNDGSLKSHEPKRNPLANHRQRNRDERLNNENSINHTNSSISDLQKENCTTQFESTNSIPCERQKTQLEEIPRNLYHLKLSMATASTSKDSSPTNVLSNESSHSSQPNRTSSTQQLSEEEEEDPAIFHAANSRVKRKFIDTHNMKFSTFNQQKKFCLRKKSIRWADQTH